MKHKSSLFFDGADHVSDGRLDFDLERTAVPTTGTAASITTTATD
jgi:hypothetical protein